MSLADRVAVFLDYDNVRPPAPIAGNVLAGNLRALAHRYGSITMFKAYIKHERLPSPKSVAYRSALQASGVTLVDCPHNDCRDAADKVIIVDMLAFALDYPAPATIVLISGNCDFAYAVSTLRLRGYNVILVAPKAASLTIKSVASLVLDWDSDVLGGPTSAPSTLWGDHSRSTSSVSVVPEQTATLVKRDVGPAAPDMTAPEFAAAAGMEMETTSVSISRPTVPPSSIINGHDDTYDLRDLRHTVEPWNVFQHLLADSMPASPTSESAISEVTTASYLTSATSADASPVEPAAQSPVALMSSWAASYLRITQVDIQESQGATEQAHEVSMDVPVESTDSYPDPQTSAPDPAADGPEGADLTGGKSLDIDAPGLAEPAVASREDEAPDSLSSIPVDPWARPAPVTPEALTCTASGTSHVVRTASPAAPGATPDTAPASPVIYSTASPTVPNVAPTALLSAGPTVSVGVELTVDTLAASSPPLISAARDTVPLNLRAPAFPPVTTAPTGSKPPLVSLAPSSPAVATVSRNSQSSASTSASVPRPVSASAPVPSTSRVQATTATLITSHHLVPQQFRLLVRYLEKERLNGTYPKTWNQVGMEYWNVKSVQRLTGQTKFKNHMVEAADAGIVTVTGKWAGEGKIHLKDQWHGFVL
ncbi:hypothetical protein OE88DRAFT_1734002 [Heliocybe sulcata]|uniref:NYN domain-containing protein n=1 Tax=Heliocybe sulcata TaxID=5364 RepID=A0A5C3NHJ3_9AGAM|nr:hypothetical protein OE88DRAFT_1734002 [Heliocybe sulcata]